MNAVNELICVAALAFFVGILLGIAVALIIARYIPQSVDVEIHMIAGRPPGIPPDEQDASEAWKGGGK